MSDLHGHEHGPGHGGVRSEEDRIPTAGILLVGVASLVLFLLASAGAVSYLRVRQGERPPLPIPPEVGQSKIGMVEQQLFDVAVRGERDRAVRLERLRSWGWVDRGAGVAHLPIDRAMELVVQGVRPSGPAATQEDRLVPGGQP